MAATFLKKPVYLAAESFGDTWAVFLQVCQQLEICLLIVN